MAELEILVIESPSDALEKKLKLFSDKNWDEYLHENQEENKLNFFDTPRCWVVGYIDGTLAGLLEVFVKDIVFEERQIKMAGIGGVVTDKRRRRQGFMKKILKYTFEELLPKYKLDMAMLCTEIPKLGGLYVTVGFVPLQRPYYFLNKNGVEQQEPNGMIVTLNNREIVERILRSRSKLFVGKSNF